MDFKEWVELLSKFGLPTMALIALGWVFYRVVVQTVWPFIVKQIELAQSRHAELSKEFISAMQRRDDLAAQTQRETLGALHAMSEELRALRLEVRGQKAL